MDIQVFLGILILIIIGIAIMYLRRDKNTGESPGRASGIEVEKKSASESEADAEKVADAPAAPEAPRQSSSSAGTPAPPPKPTPAPAEPEPRKKRRSDKQEIEPPIQAIEPEGSSRDLFGSNEKVDDLTLTGGVENHKPIDEIIAEAQSVKFSAYYPREIVPDHWQSMIAYVYKGMAAEKIADDAKAQLGKQMAAMRRVDDSATQSIKEGALITATPALPGFQFNPPSIQVGFFEDWHRLAFKLRTKDAPLNRATNGSLTFAIEGIIIAEIPLSVFVTASKSETAVEPIHTAQEMYNAIFCSYSHDDRQIVERVERAYQALGMDYLRDVHSLKSGQDWDDQLLKLIEEADIFQLFWSQTAASSPFVKKEWRHALQVAPQKTGFIRPVYWETPIPSVPEDLGHIHFTHQPDLAE